MKYKVGDKVKLRDDLEVGERYGNCSFSDFMTHLKGKTVTIRKVSCGRYQLNESFHVVSEEMIEYVTNKITTKDELKKGDIITLENGNKLVIGCDVFFLDIYNDNNDGGKYEDKCFNYDFTCKYRAGYDIVKVERPIGFETVYVRRKTKRKMTVAQICEQLGCDVEIIKQEE